MFFFWFVLLYPVYEWLKLTMVADFVYWLPNIRSYLLFRAKYDRASGYGDMVVIENSPCFLVICFFFIRFFIVSISISIWYFRISSLCTWILCWLMILYVYPRFLVEWFLEALIIFLIVYISGFVYALAWLYISAIVMIIVLFDVLILLIISVINIRVGYITILFAHDVNVMGPQISNRIIMLSYFLLYHFNRESINFVWRGFDLDNKRISGLLPIQWIYFISNYWLYCLFWAFHYIFCFRHKKVTCDSTIYSALGIFHLEIAEEFATISLCAWKFSLSLSVIDGSESLVLFLGPRGIYYLRTSKVAFFVFSICMLLSIFVYVRYNLFNSEFSETAQYSIPDGPAINFFQ